MTTLYRAADDDHISDCASFAQSRETAELYRRNPGFGGARLWTATVGPEHRVLDLTGRDAMERLIDLVGIDMGAIGVDEMVPRVCGALCDAGWDWVLVDESYPEDTVTWIWVGEGRDMLDLTQA